MSPSRTSSSWRSAALPPAGASVRGLSVTFVSVTGSFGRDRSTGTGRYSRGGLEGPAGGPGAGLPTGSVPPAGALALAAALRPAGRDPGRAGAETVGRPGHVRARLLAARRRSVGLLDRAGAGRRAAAAALDQVRPGS